MDNVIDNLQIEIESSSTSASEQINKLVLSLRKLDKLGQSSGISTLNKHLKKFANIDFSATSRHLSKIAKSVKELCGLKLSNLKYLMNMNFTDSPKKKKPEQPPESLLDEEDMSIDVVPTSSGELNDMGGVATDVQERINSVTSSTTQQITELESKLSAIQRLFDIASDKAVKLGQDYQKALEEFGEKDLRTIDAEVAFHKATLSARAFEDQLNRVKTSLDQVQAPKRMSGLQDFGKSLKRIALYRIIRTIVSAIGNAIKNGIQNIAQYSKSANAAMSKLSSTSQYLSNTLGASLMPAIITLAPALEKLGDVLAYCVTGINMFFSALQGKSTITKATKNNIDYAESLKKIQNQLGIDELNVIGEQQTSPADMFEEVDISFGELFGTLTAMTGLVTAITALFALTGKINWKTFKILAGIFVSIEGIVLSVTGFISTWNNGATWEGMAESLSGIAVLALGLFLTFGKWGAVIGIIVGSVATLVANLKDVLTNGFSLQNLIPILAAITAICVVIGLSIGWIPALIALIVAAVAVAVIAIIHYWDDIAAFFKKLWNTISNWFKKVWTSISNWFINLWNNIKNFFVGLWNDICSICSTVGDFFVEVFTTAWNGIKTAWSAVVSWFSGLWNGIKNVWFSVTSWFSNLFTSAWQGIKNAWSAVGTWFSNLWEGIKSVWSAVGTWFASIFTTAWNGIKTAWSAVGGFFTNLWNGIRNGFVSAINGIIGGFESFINFFVKGINTIIGGLNKIQINFPDWLGGGTFGINIGYVQEVRLGRIPTYSTGGLPEDDSLIYVNPYEVVGKMSNGKNVVANNQQIIEGIKEGVYEATLAANQQNGGNGDNEFEVRVFLDGRQITSTVEKYQKKKGVGGTIYKGGILNGI